jgi:hypothetical protein
MIKSSQKFWLVYVRYRFIPEQCETALPIKSIYLENGPNGLNWQCYLAGSSKTASRISIFSIAMGANYSFEVKNFEIWVPAFFKHNNSSVATELYDLLCKKLNQ